MHAADFYEYHGGNKMEIYRIEELSFSYPLKDKSALSHINLKIESGEWGPKEIDKFMKDLTVKFKEITGKDYEGTSSLKKMDDKAKKEEK